MRKDNIAFLALFLLTVMAFSLVPVNAFIYPDGSVDSNYEDFGPRLDRIQVIMYDGLDAMWTGLANGEIDVTDWPLTLPWLYTFTTPPEDSHIQVNAYGGEAGMYLIDFNENNNQWLGNPPGEPPGYPNPVVNLAANIQNPAADLYFRIGCNYLFDRTWYMGIIAGWGVMIYTPVPSYMGSPVPGGGTVNQQIRPGGSLETLIYPYDEAAADAAFAISKMKVVAGQNGDKRFWDRDDDNICDAGEEIVLNINSRQDTGRAKAAEWLTARLEAHGFVCDTDYLTGAENYQETMLDKNYHITTLGWMNLGPDPDFLYDLYHINSYWHDPSSACPNTASLDDPPMGPASASLGDLRLTAVGSYPAGSLVSSTHTDAYQDLVLFVSNEKHDESLAGNSLYDPGEYMYRDADSSLVVSAGDTRLTAFGSYAAGSIVAALGEYIYTDTDVSGAVSAGDVRLTAFGSYAAGSTVAALGEFIYKDVDSSGAVSAGDLRLTAVGSYPAGSTVASGDTDIGQTLVAFTSSEKHMENVVADGLYNVGEFVYKDADNNGLVSVGDIRLTVVGAYPAGSTVALSDGDIGLPIVSFASTEKHRENLFVNGLYDPGDSDLGTALVGFASKEKHRENVAANSLYDVGEYVYNDTDASGAVSAGDIRLTVVGSYPAGSTVVVGDSDVGQPLVAFASLEKHRESQLVNGRYDPGDADLGRALVAFTSDERHRENVLANGLYDPGEYIYRDGGTELKTWAETIKFSTTAAGALTAAWGFQERFARIAAQIPLFSPDGYKAHSRTYVGGTPGEAPYVGDQWMGLCDQMGFGDNSWYSFENAYPNGHDFSSGGMTIRYGWKETGYPQHINPLYSEWYWDAEVLGKVYDTLGHRNPYTLSTWQPYLIENWTVGTWNDGGVTKSKVKITLRPDIKWADGYEVTVDDVIYSLTQVSHDLVNYGYPPPWSWPTTENVQSAYALDPYNIEILFAVQSFLAESWALGGFYIIPKHIWKPIVNSGDPTGFAPDPNVIGSGPWRFVEMIPGVALWMVANRPGSVVTTDRPGAWAITSPGVFNGEPVDIQAYEKSYYAKFLPGSNLVFRVRLNNLWTGTPLTVDKYVTIKKTLPTTAPNNALNGSLISITSSTLGLVLLPGVPDVEEFKLDNAYAGKIQINVTIVYQTAPLVALKRTIFMDLWVTLKEDIGLILMGSPGFPTPDFKIDGKDIAIVAKAFGTSPGQLRWSPVADLTGDYKVDGKDIAKVARLFGWHE